MLESAEIEYIKSSNMYLGTIRYNDNSIAGCVTYTLNDIYKFFDEHLVQPDQIKLELIIRRD